MQTNGTEVNDSMLDCGDFPDIGRMKVRTIMPHVLLFRSRLSNGIVYSTILILDALNKN